MAAIAVLFLLLYWPDRGECVNQCVSRYPSYFRGYYMKANDCPGATLRNASQTDGDVICCIFDTTIVPSIPQNVSVSREVYLAMVGDTTRTRALYPFYMKALSTADIIGNKLEIAAFTAQILYQTSGLRFSEESSYGEKPTNEGGNDKRKFISRGFLPLIGQHFYELASSAVKEEIIDQPEMVALPSIGFKVASWLWKEGYASARNISLTTGSMGDYCNGTEYSFVELSHKIQNSSTGIERLFQYWRHTTKVLGLSCPSQGQGPLCYSGQRKGRCKLMRSCKGEYTTEGCPGPSPIACCLDCQNPIDLAFVLDSSGSVSQANFQLGLQFIVRVCEYFDIGYPHGTRVAVIRYSSAASILIRFNTYINKEDVLNAIRAIPRQVGSTRTDLALLLANRELFNNSDNGVRPKDLGVPRVLVLLTDGRSTSGIKKVIEQSNLLRQEGVNIFAMGIGRNINNDELNIIASDPDVDHVFYPKTYAEVNSMVEKMREASCYEPALLEEEKEVMSDVQSNTVKYYKYDLQNKTGIKTLFIETMGGGGRVSVSMKDTNPRGHRFNLGFCETGIDDNFTTSGDIFMLEELESNDFCDVHENGGCTEPRFVSDDEFLEEGIITYVKRCSSRWFYVSIEGINRTNKFNLTLYKDFIRTNNIENITEETELNKTATFPIPQNVYVGVAVATIGTSAAIASVVTLSCAKDFQLKGSTKIKRRKRKNNKNAEKNNNGTVNSGFEKDDEVNKDVKFDNLRNRSSTLSPLIEKYEHMSSEEPSRIATEERKGRQRVCSIDVAEMENMQIKKTRSSSFSAENQGRKSSTQTVTIANTNETKRRPTRISLVSSMIQDLQREDTIIKETTTSVNPSGSPEKRNSRVAMSQFKRQITSTSVSLSLRTRPETPKTPQPNKEESDEKTACCFRWKPFYSQNKAQKSRKKVGDSTDRIDLEKSITEEEDNKEEKVSFLKRVKRKLTWRNTLAVLFPCFTYYILMKGNKEKPSDNKEDKSEKGHCEMRDRRFERDMQMTQAFCVFLSQLLFLAGADARDNQIACAVVAIAMNYLSLVTVTWLIVQAMYLFSFTRSRESETKQRLKINLYYAGAWGLPLFAVVILASKYESYNKHPHCWISFSDALSWSVATPMITLGLVQFVLVILLVKASVTFRKSGDANEHEDKKNVVKSGLKTVVCITITVIVTWLLGSLSLNIDKDVYHVFFTIFNALQGFAFFLFYVVLNPQVRQLLVTVWEWKESSVTPFDEHEAIEIEEEEEKEKKKGKGKGKAGPENKEKDAKPEEQVTTVHSVAGARLAASSMANKTKPKNKENGVTLVKFGERKETEKANLADKPSRTVSVKKLAPISQPNKNTLSNLSREPRARLEMQGPWTVKTPARKPTVTLPKEKRPRSPSPSGQQLHVSLHQDKKKTQLQIKDKVPETGFSGSPNSNIHPRPSPRKLQPITTQSQRPKAKPTKQVDRKKTSTVKKM